MNNEHEQSQMDKYKKISKLYKEIVDTLTTQSLPQIKLYFVRLGEKIAGKEDDVCNDFKDVSELLNHLKQAQGKVPLHYAVAKGDLEVVRYLIETLKADWSVKDKQQNTAFFTAVEHGSLPITQYLVEELKCSPHAIKQGEITALHIAANNNHTEIMEYLISQGCEVDKLSVYGTPLNWAVGHGNLEATKMLLEHGADGNGDKTAQLPPPLIIAIDFGSKEIYEALINAPKPADFNSKDHEGYTALHVAAEKGKLQFVQDLTSKGAQPNIAVHGKTPLYLAFKQQKWEVVAYLKNITKDQEEIQKQVKLAKQKEAEEFKAHPIDKQKAEEIKNQGNKLYTAKRNEEALIKYKEALVFDHDNVSIEAMQEVIHRNLAACYLALQKYHEALEHCHKAKLLNAKNVKNLYRQAQAYAGLKNYIQAAGSMWQCAMLEPANAYFKQQFKKYVSLGQQAHQNL